MRDLTEHQERILVFVEAYREHHGYSPSFAEIAEHFKVNVFAIQQQVKAIVRKGKMTVTPGVARSLVPA